MEKPKSRAALIVNILRVLLVILLSAGVIWYFASGQEFSIDAILHYTPDDYFLAALFMMLLYAVKTILIFPPIMALQIAVGLFFPTWAAILVNILCMVLEHSIGYAVGRFVGLDVTDKLLKKHPKVRDIVQSTRNRWFISYILRALNMLPMDIVSMYLGTLKFPFGVYVTGSLAGSLFGILAATIIGRTLTDPTSPSFIIACAISISLSIISCLIYYFLSKGKAHEDSDKR